MFPDEPALRNTRTMNFLKMLLHIEGTGACFRIQSVMWPMKVKSYKCCSVRAYKGFIKAHHPRLHILGHIHVIIYM